jgi:uncharacterized membrane protein
MNNRQILASAILAAIALPAISQAGPAPAPAPKFDSEKCYGVNAKGSNDCAGKAHACAGQSTQAKDPESWIYVPAGTCKKIDGGKLSKG